MCNAEIKKQKNMKKIFNRWRIKIIIYNIYLTGILASR